MLGSFQGVKASTLSGNQVSHSINSHQKNHQHFFSNPQGPLTNALEIELLDLEEEEDEEGKEKFHGVKENLNQAGYFESVFGELGVGYCYRFSGPLNTKGQFFANHPDLPRFIFFEVFRL